MIEREMHSVVVIGGYGAVGRTVCTELADHIPSRVFAAGRNVKKAESFSQETGGRVWPLKLDIANPSAAAKALEGAEVVVVCGEPGDASFARVVLERGIHYVDVSASYAYLQQVERLDALARRRHGGLERRPFSGPD
jgi:saccharopine dehydrogenase (NAD+, L-lysine forming)